MKADASREVTATANHDGEGASVQRVEHRPLVTVIVPTHNRQGRIEELLDCISRQAFRDFEVLVVANGCRDDTASSVRGRAASDARFRLLDLPRPGKSRALNAGLREARGSIVVCTDDDVRVPHDWIERILAAFSSAGAECGVVAGSICPRFETPPMAWQAWGDAVSLGKTGFISDLDDLRRICGANVSFRRDAIVAVGGFDERLGPVGSRYSTGEDTEIVLRIAQRFSVYYDAAIAVQHWVPAEKMKLSYKLWRSYRSGEASSRVCGSRLLTERVYLRLRRRMQSQPSSTAPHDLRSTLIRAAFWLGRIRGARLV